MRPFIFAAIVGCAALTGCTMPILPAPAAPAVNEAVPPPALEDDAATNEIAPENWLPAPRASAAVREHKTAPVRTGAVVHSTHVVTHHHRGGCGSRGGPGYRLPNGRCASRRQSHHI